MQIKFTSIKKDVDVNYVNVIKEDNKTILQIDLDGEKQDEIIDIISNDKFDGSVSIVKNDNTEIPFNELKFHNIPSRNINDAGDTLRLILSQDKINNSYFG